MTKEEQEELDRQHTQLDATDAAVLVWCAITKGDPNDTDESDIQDLITDLLHLAEERYVNDPEETMTGEEVADAALRIFTAERDGDIFCNAFNYKVRQREG